MAPRQQTSATGGNKRQILIQAAFHTIAEKGFEGLRIQEVAAQVGMHHATLYHYFPTKEDLIRGVMEHLRQELITVSPGVAGENDNTPLGLIRSMFLQIRLRLRKTPDLFVVMHELTLRSIRDSAIGEMLKHIDNRWHTFLSQTLTEGVRQGTFRADLDPEKAATELIVIVKGILQVSLIDPARIDFDYLIKDIERLLCQ